MVRNFEKLVAEAKKKVTEISPADAAEKSKSGGAVIVDRSPIDVKGTGTAIGNTGAPTVLSNLTMTLDKGTNTSPALNIGGNGSALSHVTIGGNWAGPAIVDSGSLTVSDTRIVSGPSPSSALLELNDGGTQGHAVSFQRSRLQERSSAQPLAMASNVSDQGARRAGDKRRPRRLWAR